MIVPDYWAEARKQHRAKGRQVTVRRFGWSNSSAEDAVTMAEQRAEEALRRLVSGEKLLRREPKVPYNGAAGVPIREEVLARHGEEVITRNAYGAHCLNSPHALFADVDFEPRENFLSIVSTFAALVLLSALAGTLRGSWGLGIGLFFVSLLFAAPLAKLARRLLVVVQGGSAKLTKRRLVRFIARHPEWNVRVYRTPAGLRLFATHSPYEPSDAKVNEFFRAIAADPVYVRMCRNQQCFRARLTAKPWRIGIATHVRPRPGVWPVSAERMSLRSSWVSAYDAQASEFASCRYVESVGSGIIHERLRPVVALHDTKCRANDLTATIA